MDTMDTDIHIKFLYMLECIYDNIDFLYTLKSVNGFVSVAKLPAKHFKELLGVPSQGIDTEIYTCALRTLWL